jgi:UDP-glucose 4-epimerase
MTHSLVTGGAGFIGSHLVDALVARGDRISVLDNLSSGSLDFLAGVRDSIEFHELDLLDEDFDAHLAEVDIVWHLSANPEVRTGIDAPEVMFRQNVDATRCVLAAMARCISPPLTVSNPLPRSASVRRTAWLELDFMAKHTR